MSEGTGVTVDRRTRRSRSAVLSADALMLDFVRSSDVTTPSGLAVGRSGWTGSSSLSVTELNGRAVLSVKETQERLGRAVYGADDALLGHVGSFGYWVEVADRRVAEMRGLVRLRVVDVSRAELARVTRQPHRPNWRNNVATRFFSARYRIDFATPDPSMRCLIIAMTFIHHCTRLDE